MVTFLHAYAPWAILGLNILAVIIACVWWKKPRQEEGIEPEQFAWSLLVIAALIAIWCYVGPLWALLTFATVVASIAWLSGHRAAAVSMVIIALFALGTWKIVVWAISPPQQKQGSSATVIDRSLSPAEEAALSATTSTDDDTGSDSKFLGSAMAQMGVKAMLSGMATQTENVGCDDESISGKTPVTADGIEQPLISPRPSKQPCHGNTSTVTLTPLQTIPQPAIMPISGRLGSDLEWGSPTCKFTLNNRVSCKLYVMSSVMETRQDIWLDSVDGVDDQRVAFRSLATWGTLYFEGTGKYTAQLQPAAQTGFAFSFERNSPITTITFTLQYSLDGQTKHPLSFMQVPVAQN